MKSLNDAYGKFLVEAVGVGGIDALEKDFVLICKGVTGCGCCCGPACGEDNAVP